MRSRETETIHPGTTPVVDPFATFRDGEVLAGRFEIRGTLGRGGTSWVYRAWDRTLEREVAIKALRSDRPDEGGARRLRREVEVARDVVHPNLVRIFDVGVERGLLFVTMELVEGESLRDLIAQGPPPLDRLREIAEQTLGALAALHEARVLHRDVKPGNILLDHDGRVRLADFGLARKLDGDAETRSLAGTLEYLSPEQALGKTLTPASDVYSFGLVLYEMAVGELPGVGATDVETLLSRVDRDLPDPRRQRPEIPRWLARAILHFTESSPDRRPKDAAAALRDFRARSSPSRWRRFVLPAAAIATMVGGLVVGGTMHSEGRFESIAVDSRALQAVSESGRVLWSIEVDHPDRPLNPDSFTVARTEPGEPPRVVGIRNTWQADDPRDRRLEIRDAQTGAVIETVELPDAVEEFEPDGMAPNFTALVQADDIDADGLDDILVTYVHRPYWPCYAVLWNPRTRLRRVVLVASGHHRYAGSVDLDADGRRELLFSGINNRLGWASGLAAVRVPTVESSSRLGPARTPDRPQGQPASLDGLLWYAALSPDHCDHPGCLEIDRDRRRIVLERSSGSAPTVLDYRGLPVDGSSELAPEDRSFARRAAHRDLREALRLAEGDFSRAAVESAENAVSRARAAGLDFLAVWALRIEGRLLAEAGRLDEAEEVFEQASLDPELAHDAAYDAGRAFHLAGRPLRAIEWFRRGFGVKGLYHGRPAYEYAVGIALAGSEIGAWDRVLREVEAFDRIYDVGDRPSRILRAYVTWRSGGEFDLDRALSTRSDREWRHAPSLFRYWSLELRLAAGRTEGLRERVAREREEIHASLGPHLDSLSGALLLAANRPAEALPLLREAAAELRNLLDEDPQARAHYSLALERFARAAEESGDAAASRDARRRLEEWRRAVDSSVPEPGSRESS